MTSTTSSQHRRGFTLVELLVVIGIIALLLTLLLPTLGKARMAAQDAQCLSNLRQIGQATVMYRSETGRIPFFFVLRNYPWQPVADNGTGNALWWTAFSYGGKTTHNTISVGYIEDAAKPLNKYLYKDIFPEPWTGAKTSPDQRLAREAFRCPADDGSGMGRGVGKPVNYLGPTVASPYELYGTSYMSNRGFMYDYEIVQLFYKTMTAPWTHAKVNFYNQGVSRIVTKWNASETYVAADIWFLWSLFYQKQIAGAHSSQPYHNGVFLDGHATRCYITQRDLDTAGGTYVPGKYVPKYGSGWREVRQYGSKGYAGGGNYVVVPWSGTDPFGVNPDQRPMQ